MEIVAPLFALVRFLIDLDEFIASNFLLWVKTPVVDEEGVSGLNITGTLASLEI